MADLPTQSGSQGGTDEDNGRTPRWVYVLGIIALVLAVAIVIVHVAGGGMGNHMPR